MGVRQRGHSGFSLHHSVIQFLHVLHQTEDKRGKESCKWKAKRKHQDIPAENMATGSSCWVLTITQAKCALANPTNCMMLKTEKGFIKHLMLEMT